MKFVINGSNFNYGKLLVYYTPLASSDRFSITHFPVDREQNLVSYSQRPNILLDACGSHGGTITMPYIYHTDSVVIPTAEWINLGTIGLKSFTSLKHANGNTDTVEIHTFLWATDVSLIGSTSASPANLVPQSGSENTGVVSGKALILAKIAGMLTKAPVIGPWAMATQTLAGDVGAIARMFGFSRPTTIEQPMKMIPNHYPNIANTNLHDTAIKLSLDVKQENTVDTRVLGLAGEDEMTITSIAKRPSYLTQFGWSPSTSTEALLFTCRVTPWLYTLSGYSGSDAPVVQQGLIPTPMCFAAMPFSRWRGTIKFRFFIVASPYHRGRLVLRFDPRAFTSNEFNTNETLVVDIEDTHDFELSVGWAQPQPYCLAPNLIGGANLLPFNNAGPRFGVDDRANGVIEVAVLNRLTSPNNVVNNDIRVLVYVSADDDFEVVGPDNHHLQQVSFFPQSGMEEMKNCEDDPMCAMKSYKFSPSQPARQIQAIYDGDPVTSFRQVLKRYNYHDCHTLNFNDWVHITLTTSDFPRYRGRIPSGIDFTNNSATPPVRVPANACKMTLLNFLTPAFLCRTGGLRHMYVFPKGVNPTWSGPHTISRNMRLQSFALNATPLPANSASPGSSETLKSLVNSFENTGLSAMAITDDNNVLTVELPYSVNRKFLPARHIDFTTPDINTCPFTSHTLHSYMRYDTQSRITIKDYVSIAEDFNLSMFLNAPVLFYGQPFPVLIP